jgi:hypothetical protein
VIGPSGTVRVVVATRPVDFRKGMEGLAALVREHMNADPFTGTVYVFRAKRAPAQFRVIVTSLIESVEYRRPGVAACKISTRDKTVPKSFDVQRTKAKMLPGAKDRTRRLRSRICSETG